MRNDESGGRENGHLGVQHNLPKVQF